MVSSSPSPTPDLSRANVKLSWPRRLSIEGLCNQTATKRGWSAGYDARLSDFAARNFLGLGTAAFGFLSHEQNLTSRDIRVNHEGPAHEWGAAADSSCVRPRRDRLDGGKDRPGHHGGLRGGFPARSVGGRSGAIVSISCRRGPDQSAGGASTTQASAYAAAS
jgi:hypothetical protein